MKVGSPRWVGMFRQNIDSCMPFMPTNIVSMSGCRLQEAWGIRPLVWIRLGCQHGCYRVHFVGKNDL